MVLNLNNHQILTACLALNIAAEQYHQDAQIAASTPRVAARFTKQEAEALELAQHLEEMTL